MDNFHSYEALIKSIKRKKKTVVIITIIVILLTITFCSPIYINLLDKIIINYKGISPFITALLVVFILFCELIAYLIVLAPLTTSMDIECDPQKHLILNTKLNKQKNKDYIYVVDYIYMGNFTLALDYARKMTASKKTAEKLVGLFNMARCEFFLNDFASLKTTVENFETTLSLDKNKNLIYTNLLKTMKLLVAIADEDKELILEHQDVEVWNKSKATQGYINYLKGLAAYSTSNKELAIYNFVAVKEICGKTVFSKLAEEHLQNLK